jgi:hypothetical protein
MIENNDDSWIKPYGNIAEDVEKMVNTLKEKQSKYNRPITIYIGPKTAKYLDDFHPTPNRKVLTFRF